MKKIDIQDETFDDLVAETLGPHYAANEQARRGLHKMRHRAWEIIRLAIFERYFTQEIKWDECEIILAEAMRRNFA